MIDIRDSVIRQLHALQAGDPWFGSARADLLRDLEPAQAAGHPVPGAHSIWELVLHMTAWTREVGRRLRGGAPSEPEMGDWPAVGRVSKPAWTKAQEDLERAHAELIAAVRALPPERWLQIVGQPRDAALGTGVDVAGTLVGLGEHDAYHCGQIALLRRALQRA